MALTAAEQQELAELKRQKGTSAPVAKAGGLTPEEEAELKSLKKQSAQAPQPTEQYGLGQTALEHGTNAATLGYLPQVVGAMEPVTRGLGNAVLKGQSLLGLAPEGAQIEPESYVQQRDQMAKRLSDSATQNPKTALASQVGGAVASGLATPFLNVGKAASIGGGIARGAGAGAIQGAIMNPGDVEGVVNPTQLSERAGNAAIGGAIGGVAGGITEGVRKGFGAIKNAPATLKDAAEGEAVHASGAMLKDFRQLEGKGRTNELGRFALDNKLVQAGDTVETIAQKADALRKKSGNDLGNIYRGVVEDFNAAGAAENLTGEAKAKLGDIGFNPARDKAKLLEEVSKAMGNKEGKKAAVQRLDSYLDQLIEDHGDNVLDPKLSQEIKTEMDKVAGWARNPMTNEPAIEAAYKKARDIVSKKIDEEIDTLGKLSGRPDALKELKTANKNYGNSIQIAEMAGDKTSRNMANRRVSLTDTIAGGSGGVAGTGVGLLMSNDPREVAGMGLLGGLAVGAANKYGKKYGPAMIASGANKLVKPAQILSPLGKAGMLVPNSGLVSRGLVNLKEQPRGK